MEGERLVETAPRRRRPIRPILRIPKAFSPPHDNSIIVLQRRGAVFLACHNEVWELTMGLHSKGINPDHLSHEEMAAEFPNHLIPGVVLTPGIVGTLPELQLAGYQYAK